MGLELYAKIEPLLGFDEEIDALHDLYLEILSDWRPETLIDIGCGSGRFLRRARETLGLKRAYGVDLSETMVRRARETGVEADAVDVCDVQARFDAATAVFDVLNYLPDEALPRFFGCVAGVLKPGGIFLADINTQTGFEEVAPGSLIRSHKTWLLALDAVYDAPELRTKIELFTKREGECYSRESDIVTQYYHDPARLAQQCGDLELIQSYPVRMYADEPDKELLLFKRK
ncbi:class I SAM-dependent methyltransferase [Hydrogenimonas sp. SS33]|uniref:class I SAM-dependent DNA methyltransferase n=1 Tax=Hydrogenimonas leucolamina TaxID=2954236 RepID=UPI00336C03BC